MINDAEEFDKLAAATFPKAAGIKTTIETVRDGFHPRTRLFKLELSGVGLLEAVLSQAGSAVEAVTGARQLYATARRKFDTARVLSECVRLSDHNLSAGDEVAEGMREKLMRCRLSEFQDVAATCRKHAQTLAQQAA